MKSGDKKRAQEIGSLTQGINSARPETRHTIDVKTLRTFR